MSEDYANYGPRRYNREYSPDEQDKTEKDYSDIIEEKETAENREKAVKAEDNVNEVNRLMNSVIYGLCPQRGWVCLGANGVPVGVDRKAEKIRTFKCPKSMNWRPY